MVVLSTVSSLLTLSSCTGDVIGSQSLHSNDWPVGPQHQVPVHTPAQLNCELGSAVRCRQTDRQIDRSTDWLIDRYCRYPSMNCVGISKRHGGTTRQGCNIWTSRGWHCLLITGMVNDCCCHVIRCLSHVKKKKKVKRDSDCWKNKLVLIKKGVVEKGFHCSNSATSRLISETVKFLQCYRTWQNPLTKSCKVAEASANCQKKKACMAR